MNAVMDSGITNKRSVENLPRLLTIKMIFHMNIDGTLKLDL